MYLQAGIQPILEENDLLYTIALTHSAGIGDIIAKRLISHCGSVSEVFKTRKQQLLKIPGIGISVINALKDESNLKRAEKELAFIEKNRIKSYYFLDEAYPDYLKNCYDAPVLLFSKGNIELKNKKIISIVGTRQITAYGKVVLEQFFEDIKYHDPVIVSGLAYGVDIYAHRLAVQHNLQTVAILAHGLDRIYPAVHKKYADRMLSNGGLMTDYRSETQPDRENFVKRNRIIAGISQATVVIESAEKGGSLITTDIANSYNRDVFAFPGRVTDTYSAGCNKLIKTNRAAALTSAKDLTYLLNWQEDTGVKAVQKQLFVELTEEEQHVYNYLLKEGKQQLDMIALHCNMPIFKMATMLLNLELKGVIKPMPGKIFEAV